MPFSRVNPGDLIQAQNLDQVIDSLNGVTAKGIPIAETSVNDASNYAVSIQNVEATNSRALNVLKSDGTTLIKADVTGVTLGSPLNLPASSITSTAIADGTIQNADLGPDVARANLLTNGGFEIWQRGNGPFTTTVFAADRWQLNIAGTDTLSVSKDTTNLDSGSGSQTCAACTFTLGTGAGATLLQQANMNLATEDRLAGKTVTLSMRVRCTTANAVRIGINDYYSATSHWTYSSYHTGGGSYETLTVTVPLNSTLAGSPRIIQPAVSFWASCTAYIDNAMLVVGSQAANYVPLHPADDLARCLRYYELLGETTGIAYGCYLAAAGFNVDTTVTFKARKAVTPTVTKLGSWSVSNCPQPTVPASGVDLAWVRTSPTAVGQMSYVGAVPSISVEANP